MAKENAVCFGILVVLVLVMSIVLLSTSIKKLEANEQAIMYDTVAKHTLSRNTQGLFAGPPFFSFLKFSAVYTTVDLSVPCLTTDGLPVTLAVSFQYVPSNQDLYDIVKQWRDAWKYQDVITVAATSAVVDACSQYNISYYQSGRPVIQTKIDKSINANLKALKADALAAQLVNVDVPDDWRTATSDKQRSAQDIDFALNERAQAVAQAANNVVLAQQDALITNQSATTNISIVLTAARQSASAVAAEYKAFGDVLLDMMKIHKLNFAGLMAFLENMLVRASYDVDLVLPKPLA